MTNSEIEELTNKIIKSIGNVFSRVIVIFFIAFLAKLVWNIIIPEVFSGPTITYWQSLGLIFLSNIFFKHQIIKE